jgi:hypothetical protein
MDAVPTALRGGRCVLVFALPPFCNVATLCKAADHFQPIVTNCIFCCLNCYFPV